jgi:hypothetical protein
LGPRRTILRLRPAQCRLPPQQNPPLHSIFHLTQLDRQFRKLSLQVRQVLFRIPTFLCRCCLDVSFASKSRRLSGSSTSTHCFNP